MQSLPGFPTIDWLTITGRDVWPDDVLNLNSKAILEYLWAIVGDGEAVEPQAKGVMQYKGWNHEKIFVGQSDQGTMMQLRSWAADALFDECDQSDTCTRIDLAVTFQAGGTEWEGNKLGKLMYDAVKGYGRERAKYWVEPRLSIDEAGGDLLELGARSSDRYIRVYNKTLEGKDERFSEGEWWRAEVEYKGDLARKAFAFLARDHGRWGRILGLVADELSRRGSIVPFDQARAESVTLARPSRTTTDDSRIKWLKEQVRPTVEKLVAAGYYDHDIAGWLGLQVVG